MSDWQAQRRIEVFVDHLGLAISGSVTWFDAFGREVECVTMAAGPFDNPSDFAQILADQKPRSRIDKGPISIVR